MVHSLPLAPPEPLPPLVLKALLVKADFWLVGFAAWSPGLGAGGGGWGGDRWFPRVGHLGESQERNPGRFPQPGEPFGRP